MGKLRYFLESDNRTFSPTPFFSHVPRYPLPVSPLILYSLASCRYIAPPLFYTLQDQVSGCSSSHATPPPPPCCILVTGPQHLFPFFPRPCVCVHTSACPRPRSAKDYPTNSKCSIFGCPFLEFQLMGFLLF